MSIELADPTGSDGGGYDEGYVGKIYIMEPPPGMTIYRDIENLPSPVRLGITVRYYNYDDEDLYFQITGEAPGYTVSTVNMGLLGSGLNAFRNLDEFASRAKPTQELEESIKLILRAYTDAGYTNLKHTYERVVDVIFIDSADPSYTIDVLNNFDDGTLQGWAALNEILAPGYAIAEVVTDYVLSPPNSCRVRFLAIGSPAENRARLYKSFTTPDKDVIYAIFDLRVRHTEAAPAYHFGKFVRIQRDTTPLVFIGRPYDAVASTYIPINKWMRVVVPLPKNTTLELRVVWSMYCGGPGFHLDYLWLDDFKIISK